MHIPLCVCILYILTLFLLGAGADPDARDAFGRSALRRAALHGQTSICICTYVYICIHNIYICMYICMYVCIYIHVWMYMYIYVCVCMYMYMYRYVCVYYTYIKAPFCSSQVRERTRTPATGRDVPPYAAPHFTATRTRCRFFFPPRGRSWKRN